MKLIKKWKDLQGLKTNEYKIIINDCCGWIVPICDDYGEENDFICNCNTEKDFYKHHIYLSTHTFYGSQYKYSTNLLQSYGFDVEIDNWDKEKED